MQLTRRMKIEQAKAYVAQKLNLTISDPTDETTMAKVRSDKGLGSVIPDHAEYMGI